MTLSGASTAALTAAEYGPFSTRINTQLGLKQQAHSRRLDVFGLDSATDAEHRRVTFIPSFDERVVDLVLAIKHSIATSTTFTYGLRPVNLADRSEQHAKWMLTGTLRPEKTLVVASTSKAHGNLGPVTDRLSILRGVLYELYVTSSLATPADVASLTLVTDIGANHR